MASILPFLSAKKARTKRARKGEHREETEENPVGAVFFHAHCTDAIENYFSRLKAAAKTANKIDG